MYDKYMEEILKRKEKEAFTKISQQAVIERVLYSFNFGDK